MCYDNEYRMNKSRREKIMKKRIVFATGNAGKMKEIKMILGDLGMPVVSMKEAGIEADIVEERVLQRMHRSRQVQSLKNAMISCLQMILDWRLTT